MNQTHLNRAVARATGETVERIQRMGFSLMPRPRVWVPVARPAARKVASQPNSARR